MQYIDLKYQQKKIPGPWVLEYSKQQYSTVQYGVQVHNHPYIENTLVLYHISDSYYITVGWSAKRPVHQQYILYFYTQNITHESFFQSAYVGENNPTCLPHI